MVCEWILQHVNIDIKEYWDVFLHRTLSFFQGASTYLPIFLARDFLSFLSPLICPSVSRILFLLFETSSSRCFVWPEKVNIFVPGSCID